MCLHTELDEWREWLYGWIYGWMDGYRMFLGFFIQILQDTGYDVQNMSYFSKIFMSEFQKYLLCF